MVEPEAFPTDHEHRDEPRIGGHAGGGGVAARRADQSGEAGEQVEHFVEHCLRAGIAAVDLVDHQHHRYARVGQRTRDVLVLARPAAGLDQEQYQVHVLERRASDAVHVPVQGALRRQVDARRVDVDDLATVGGLDAGDPLPRGLRLRGNDAEFLTQDPVHQRRLADVGPADQRDVTAAVIFREQFVHAASPCSLASSCENRS